MMKLMLTAVMYLILGMPQAAVPPLNKTAAAVGCNNTTVMCTYIDSQVPPGQHFYFAVAQKASGLYSKPSNVVFVTVPAGTHSVTLTWAPSSGTDSTTGYFIYRGAPATNLTGTSH